MAEVINHTEVFCHACASPHPARQLLDNGKIIGIVDCPVAPWQTTLSEHADLFLQFRQQAHYDPDFQAPERPYYFHYLAITDDCNCQCPVCFTAASPQTRNVYLTLDEAEQVAGTALKNGVQTVVFIGGEPTIHPQLFELIAIFRQAKLQVWIATNGMEIARTPQLAAQLKSVGVSKVCLQFDTLDAATHLAIRGHQKIDAKIAAAQAISDAGLVLGLVCTVTSHNLEELPSFCRSVMDWPQPPRTIAIQAAAHAGRLTTDTNTQITREEIVAALIKGQAIAGLTASHFWPIPIFQPLNIFVHPDCAANTVVVITATGISPLSRYVDMERLLGLAQQSPEIPASRARTRHLFFMVLKSIRWQGVKLLINHFFARMRGRAGVRMTFIGTGAFLRPDFLDTARINRCASGVLTTSGCDSLCRFYSKKPFNQARNEEDL